MARPREFDEADVLDRAMQVFCSHGYEGASISALSSAMRLTAPSIYAAFGSKRGLFEAVLDRHVTCQKPERDQILSAPTAREAAERWLNEVAENLPRHKNVGSLLMLGGLLTAPDNQDIPVGLAKRRQAHELSLWDRFERAQACGDLPPGANPAALAAFVTTVYDGMIVRAATGAQTTELKNIAAIAMRGWSS